MTLSTSAQELSAQWNTARRLYPIYFELAREFVIDVQPSADLEAGVETPGKEAVEQANRWIDEMDRREITFAPAQGRDAAETADGDSTRGKATI